MASPPGEAEEKAIPPSTSHCLQKLHILKTQSNFYIIGRDKTKSYWRLLKISRSEPSELNIVVDPAIYTEEQCTVLLEGMQEAKERNGGVSLVANCYGIIGFIKFLGPYYMLIITKRKKIGTICGHSVYTVTGTRMIPIANSSELSNMPFSKDENRYKNLLYTLDLRKNFFFSYSYDIMCSLQQNMCDEKTQTDLHGMMFVWNEYLTREIRRNLRSSRWTVALVHGFFKQETFSVSGKPFKITLIARRSRHYAGTRYLKRGLNESGQVANDVETEQIITQDVSEGHPIHISSVVQHRGSIPLFWSHKSSRFKPRPDIILSRKDPEYGTTRLHFENLFSRYGKHIAILDLIKNREKAPRESVVFLEYSNAVKYIQRQGFDKDNGLVFYHMDLSTFHKKYVGATKAVLILCDVAKEALNSTGLFHHQEVEADQSPNESLVPCSFRIKRQMLQNGVLRTNCIDCVDRTNVAQYAFGLVALGRQIQALGLSDNPDIDVEDPLGMALMNLYETMGDALAQQYGGSTAQNKIFRNVRGQWKPATRSQEIFRVLQRFISNKYIDPEKQDAIDLFLGHFQPELGKSEIWKRNFLERSGSRNFRRSFSDGMIIRGSNIDHINTKRTRLLGKLCRETSLPNSSPMISSGKSDLLLRRDTPSDGSTQHLRGLQDDAGINRISTDELNHDHESSNFINLDWLSSSESLLEVDSYRRGSTFKRKPPPAQRIDNQKISDFSNKFIQWVEDGGALYD